MTIINTIVIIALVFYIVHFYNKAPLIFPFMIPFLQIVVINVVSTAYIEEGVYMADLAKESYMTGGTVRMIILYFIFIFSMQIMYRKKRNSFQKIETRKLLLRQQKRIILISTIYVLYLLADVAVSGSVLTNSAISRFNYMSNYTTLPLIGYLSAFRNPVAFISGVVFVDAERKVEKVFSAIIPILLIISWILIGNQFFGNISIIEYFIIPILFKATYDKKNIMNLKNTVLAGIAVCIAVLPKLSYFQNHTIYGIQGTYNTALSLLLYRAFGLQADVWWELDRQVWELGSIDFNHMFTEFASLFRVESQSKSGIFYLMERVMPRSEYLRYIDGNGTLCSGHPALEVAMWGYIGAAVAMIIEAALIYCLLKGLAREVLKRNILSCFIMSTLFCEAMKCFSVGGFFWITNTVPLLCIAYLVITRGGKKRLRFRIG